MRGLVLKVRVFGTQKWSIGRNLLNFYEPISAGVVHIINIPGAKRGIATGRNGSAFFLVSFLTGRKSVANFFSQSSKWCKTETTAKLLSVLIRRLLKK